MNKIIMHTTIFAAALAAMLTLTSKGLSPIIVGPVLYCVVIINWIAETETGLELNLPSQNVELPKKEIVASVLLFVAGLVMEAF